MERNCEEPTTESEHVITLSCDSPPETHSDCPSLSEGECGKLQLSNSKPIMECSTVSDMMTDSISGLEYKCATLQEENIKLKVARTRESN